MPIETVAQVGGIFALLTLAHFTSDFVFQSHAEAMAKPTNGWVRARHCAIYTTFMCLAILIFIPSPLEVVAYASILFLSHFFEDTYVPVYLWAKHVRKAPEFKGMQVVKEEGSSRLAKTDMERFIAFASTPLGKILLIAIDQIAHLLFLLPIATMIVVGHHGWLTLVALAWVAALALLTLYGRKKLQHGHAREPGTS